MSSPDSTLFDTIFAKLHIFDWMRPNRRRDGAASPAESDPVSSNLVGNKTAIIVKSKKIRSSLASKNPTPKLSADESALLARTAPVSTCTSTLSGVSWSDQTVGSSDSLTGASRMPSFHRLGQESSPDLQLEVPDGPLVLDTSATAKVPALLRAPPPPPAMEIPWRLVDPDSATNPMQEALDHSLGQMELRMSGRHTTTHAAASRRSDFRFHHFHRRTRSALPISRADAPDFGAGTDIVIGGVGARGHNDDDEDDGSEAPSSFWKLTPAPNVPATARQPCDYPVSPRESGTGGRAGSTAARAPASPSLSALTPISSCQVSEDRKGFDKEEDAPLADEDYDDRDECDLMFEFDDI